MLQWVALWCLMASEPYSNEQLWLRYFCEMDAERKQLLQWLWEEGPGPASRLRSTETPGALGMYQTWGMPNVFFREQLTDPVVE